jgi:hypothetical protein
MAAKELIHFLLAAQLGSPRFVPRLTRLSFRFQMRLLGPRLVFATHRPQLFFLHIRFVDKFELGWRIASQLTIGRLDLSFLSSAELKQICAFTRNEDYRGVRCTGM